MYSNTGNKGVQVFVKNEGGAVYVAVVNYENEPREFDISMSRMGVGNSKFTDLFSGDVMQSAGGQLKVKVAANDAALCYAARR